jgi:transcriptional regulator with XRE-family HTH domain
VTARYGGAGRVSTKEKLSGELRLLGELLVETRARAGRKQSDVAEKLGLPASYLSKIESGTRRLDVIELIRIAEAIGADPAEIVRELQQRIRSTA